MRGGTIRPGALLASPVFVGSVALLLLNDHVLKAAWPGPVTGKLSDVAGVAMVAIGLTALLRRAGWAFAVTAVAFTLLKTVPVAAVWAAPVLGGVTRIDPTDVAALLVLVPLWWWVHRPGRSASRDLDWRFPLRIVAVGAAVLATTATSSDEGARIEVDGARVIVRRGDETYRSSDGGASWNRVRERDVSSPDRIGGDQACLASVCWTADDRGLVRRALGDDEVVRPPDGVPIRFGRSAEFVGVAVDGGEYVVGWSPDGVARIGRDDSVVWQPWTEFDSSLGVDWWRWTSIVVMFVGPSAMLASSAAARRKALRTGLRPGGVEGLVVATALGLMGLALFTLLVAAPLLGVAPLVVVATLNTIVAVAIVPWAWSSGGPRVLPPPRPAPFGPATGAPMPPPDAGDRVG